VANYLRVGFDSDGSWRTFGLRKDFIHGQIAAEDDITASVVCRRGTCPVWIRSTSVVVKFVQNCEYRLFQRPTTPSTAVMTSKPKLISPSREILLNYEAHHRCART